MENLIFFIALEFKKNWLESDIEVTCPRQVCLGGTAVHHQDVLWQHVELPRKFPLL